MGFMTQVAIHVLIMGFVGIPRQALLDKILGGLDELLVAPVAGKAFFVTVFPFPEGGVVKESLCRLCCVLE